MKNDQLAWVVAKEGIGYAIEDYTDGSDIEDPVLRKEWQKCRKSLQKIRDLLPKEDEEGNVIEM